MGTETITSFFESYTPVAVEKMGPLRGDGNQLSIFSILPGFRREDGSPSWGRKLTNLSSDVADNHGREDGSPSWGRKPIYFDLFSQITHR